MSTEQRVSLQKLNIQPEIGTFDGFHHCRFYVGNAKQAASYYVTRFGFSPIAYEGLETGNREFATHVVGNGKALLAFTTALSNETPNQIDFNRRLSLHGDGVKDIFVNIDNVTKAFQIAKERGAKVVQEVAHLEDKNGKGTLVLCGFEVYKDTNIYLIDKSKFNGKFMPNFNDLEEDPINHLVPCPKFNFIDHIVSNHGLGDMEPTVEWYLKILDFHIFWSVDDTIIHTDYSSLKSVVIADFDETIKMPQNEPAVGKKGKSQIQEYVDYYSGSGVQHIAINVPDIIDTVSNLRNRGLQFLNVPKAYYDNLRERLKVSPIKVNEDIDILEKLGILIDFDDQGYLLQLFTKNCEDRPTLFFEFIQRHNNNGFGAGNFKSLFESIERDQHERGNLIQLEDKFTNKNH